MRWKYIVNRIMQIAVAGILLSSASCSSNQTSTATTTETDNTVVLIETSMGDIKAVLFQDKAPITVDNFVRYVKDKHYDGTIFHRVISDFMIQGGGMTPDLKEKTTFGPIMNESLNGVANERGTLAMARTTIPDSATDQFFINVKDNHFLNGSVGKPGYAVFGKVLEGMDVVDKIRYVKTHKVNDMPDVPVEPVVIKSIRIVETGDQE